MSDITSASTGSAAMLGPRVLCCSVTSTGARLAARLPYEHVHGAVIETVARRWSGLDALVVVGATGVAVRAIAPHLGAKNTPDGM
jgi:hypothetical protein